jgi:hypothetical protein
MMKLGIAAVICTFAFTGCATVTGGDTQQVSLDTRGPGGEAVNSASCTLQNNKGTWNVQSPSIVKVHRSFDDLLVQCKKEGVPDGHLRAISAVKPALFGNILFGGGIGAFVDHTTGSAYDYPDNLSVKMGERLTLQRGTDQMPEQVAQPSKVLTTASSGATGVSNAVPTEVSSTQ